jgi:hypothetical protein
MMHLIAKPRAEMCWAPLRLIRCFCFRQFVLVVRLRRRGARHLLDVVGVADVVHGYPASLVSKVDETMLVSVTWDQRKPRERDFAAVAGRMRSWLRR